MMFYALIVGSRKFEDYALLKRKCDEILRNHKEVTVVSGGARSADALAKKYAKDKGYDHIEFPADWDKMELPLLICAYTLTKKR